MRDNKTFILAIQDRIDMITEKEKFMVEKEVIFEFYNDYAKDLDVLKLIPLEAAIEAVECGRGITLSELEELAMEEVKAAHATEILDQIAYRLLENNSMYAEDLVDFASEDQVIRWIEELLYGMNHMSEYVDAYIQKLSY